MALPVIDYTVLLTGGVISFNITSDQSTLEFQRSADGGNTWTTLYSGAPSGIGTYIDAGDQTNAHLDFNTAYIYQVIDGSGTVQTPSITPSATMQVYSDDMTYLMIRMIQASLDAIALPVSIFRAKVLTAMPLSRTPELPLVTVNLDLVQQSYTGIGRNVPDSGNNQYSIPGMALRRFSVWVLAQNVETRNFYHDALIGFLCSVMSTAFSQAGLNMDNKYQYQATQGQKTAGPESPGFYYSQIMFDMHGPLNIGVTTNYGNPTNINLDIVVNNP
jgi:hypothetical protein